MGCIAPGLPVPLNKKKKKRRKRSLTTSDSSRYGTTETSESLLIFQHGEFLEYWSGGNLPTWAISSVGAACV
jgi:hypothetical protein